MGREGCVCYWSCVSRTQDDCGELRLPRDVLSLAGAYRYGPRPTLRLGRLLKLFLDCFARYSPIELHWGCHPWSIIPLDNLCPLTRMPHPCLLRLAADDDFVFAPVSPTHSPVASHHWILVPKSSRHLPPRDACGTILVRRPDRTYRVGRFGRSLSRRPR